MMDENIISKYKKAGSIAREAHAHAEKIIRPGVSILEAADSIESFIKSHGAGIAFPVNISLNEIAAHDTAFPDDTRTFSEEDIIKVDIGAHIDGYIADTARTIIFNNDHKDLVEASRAALDKAISLATPGTKISDIGEAIEDTIRSRGFLPISNLTGHYLERYNLHTGVSIPNIKTASSKRIKEGDALAIEPFATDGTGAIRDGNRATIYRLVRITPTRMQSARKIQQYAGKNFNNLPFAARWLTEPKGLMLETSLRQLVSSGSLHEYPILKEIGGGMVSQAEHTVLVFDKPIVTTL